VQPPPPEHADQERERVPARRHVVRQHEWNRDERDGNEHDQRAYCAGQQTGGRADDGEHAVGDADVHAVHGRRRHPAEPGSRAQRQLGEQRREHVAGQEDEQQAPGSDATLERCHERGEDRGAVPPSFVGQPQR
jgi:hypothetical protein